MKTLTEEHKHILHLQQIATTFTMAIVSYLKVKQKLNLNQLY